MPYAEASATTAPATATNSPLSGSTARWTPDSGNAPGRSTANRAPVSAATPATSPATPTAAVHAPAVAARHRAGTLSPARTPEPASPDARARLAPIGLIGR